jgi:hypothetical protein
MSSGERTPAPPPIGSDRWYDELAVQGARRADVERVWAEVREKYGPRLDAHQIALEAEPLVELAVWLLLHEAAPGYAPLIYLGHAAAAAEAEDPSLFAWMIRQHAAMILHSPPAVRESLEYRLAVDDFEDEDRAVVHFPSLLAQLPYEAWGRVLASSGPVPWHTKRDAYQEAARWPALHAALASGICGSIYGVYGQVDIVEAARLARAIQIDDIATRDAIEAAVSGPLELWVDELFLPESPADSRYGFLLRVRALGHARQLTGATLRFRSLDVGVVGSVQFAVAEGAWRSVPAISDPPRAPTSLGPGWVLYIVGRSEAGVDLAGQVVEAWMPGLAR